MQCFPEKAQARTNPAVLNGLENDPGQTFKTFRSDRERPPAFDENVISQFRVARGFEIRTIAVFARLADVAR